MRDRIQSREVWERIGLDADECIAHAERSGIAGAVPATACFS
jgi:hypothetical protein